MNRIVCDSGPLISFSDTCLINVVSFLSKRGVEFIIPKLVEKEIFFTPIKIHRYAFSAARLHKAVHDADLRLVTVNQRIVRQVEDAANNVFSIREKPLKILHKGEIEALVAFKQYNCSALVVDEKTTRLLIEDPELLQDSISDEYGTEVSVNLKKLKEFNNLTKNIEILRASDLTAIAAKRGFFNSFGKHSNEAFHSAIYALKYAGCSLSEKEVAYYQSLQF